MKILFSPAETKKKGGTNGTITRESFVFPELFKFRKDILDKYNTYISTATDEQLSKIFGIKDITKFEMYKKNIYSLPLMKVIERYDGVAFDYLKYASLDKTAQNYIDKNTIVFSNLFGPLLAGNSSLPEYKLKQGEKIDGFNVERHYKEHFSSALDALLENTPYLDLRAGFYTKFYKPTSEYTTLKFIKNGKVVSHWAKAYRGIVLQLLAINNIQTMEEFMNMEIDGLEIATITTKGIHTEIIYIIKD